MCSPAGAGGGAGRRDHPGQWFRPPDFSECQLLVPQRSTRTLGSSKGGQSAKWVQSLLWKWTVTGRNETVVILSRTHLMANRRGLLSWFSSRFSVLSSAPRPRPCQSLTDNQLAKKHCLQNPVLTWQSRVQGPETQQLSDWCHLHFGYSAFSHTFSTWIWTFTQEQKRTPGSMMICFKKGAISHIATIDVNTWLNVWHSIIILQEPTHSTDCKQANHTETRFVSRYLYLLRLWPWQQSMQVPRDTLLLCWPTCREEKFQGHLLGPSWHLYFTSHRTKWWFFEMTSMSTHIIHSVT